MLKASFEADEASCWTLDVISMVRSTKNLRKVTRTLINVGRNSVRFLHKHNGKSMGVASVDAQPRFGLRDNLWHKF